MLAELKVSQFAIIENLHISFKDGLNILSGETGAGKSVLLKSLALLMGGKASSDMIRSGYSQAIIEGEFDLSHRDDIRQNLENMGIGCDDKSLIVRRIIGSADKGKVYLNGQLANLSQLRDLIAPMIEVTGHATPLIEMTGQHENRNLLSKNYHLDLLDQYVGSWDQRLEFEKKFSQMRQLEEQLQDLLLGGKSSAQRLDFLIYQRDEIAGLDLGLGEDMELEQNVRKMKNMSRIHSFIDSTESALYSDDDSAYQRIHSVISKSLEMANLDPEVSKKTESLKQAQAIIEDTVYELRSYVKEYDSDPAELDRLESKLSDLRKLQKKYGQSMPEILQALISIENEIHQIQNAETISEKIRNDISILKKDLKALGDKLHDKRLKGCKLLADSINSELMELNMKGVTFHVGINPLTEMNKTGTSDVEFLCQTSPKDPKRPIAKSASGGELSRILLALKRVVGHSGFPRTYLFDEVDTGVSGETAEKVGKKLRSISKGQQVICVTHLPQVAAYGDHHYSIQKSPKDGGVSMEVVELKNKARVQEIARLISGEKITKTSIAHAEQLLAEI